MSNEEKKEEAEVEQVSEDTVEVRMSETVHPVEKLAISRKPKVSDDQIKTMVDNTPNAPMLQRVGLLREVNHRILDRVFGLKPGMAPDELVAKWADSQCPVDPVMKCPMFTFHAGCLELAKEKLAEAGHSIEFQEGQDNWEKALAVLDAVGEDTKTIRSDLARLDAAIKKER